MTSRPPTNPRVALIEDERRALISRQRRTGAALLDLCCKRDTYRDELRRRRPSWIDDEARWDEYRRQHRVRLTEAEGMIAFHEGEMTRGAEAMADCDQRIAALGRRAAPPADTRLSTTPRTQPPLFGGTA